MADEDHGSVVLRSHYFGLRKVYDGWLAPRRRRMSSIRWVISFSFDGKPEEAIAVFKANVERERGDRIDLAEPLYDKATREITNAHTQS